MSRLNSSSDATPFLVPRAVQRSGEATIGGSYSAELDVWVVETEQGVVPIIECRQMAETLTKTHARVEEADDEDDDKEILFRYPLELETKTSLSPERDDDDPSLLELITKTHAYSEKDDTTDFNLDYESVDVMAWQRQR
ncbi:hypothetical protein [Pseudomonas sp. SbOxS1]|uniref:hypothetical protein n=1 Tax=Pseudomonas sp. SbOxS1 TaxID=2723884 RepID=UPI0015D40087|nr:hypothetical protein [Pseudomonas sp. SbOxS1]